MTLKIYSAKNMEKLTNMVKESCGNVLLRLSDNSLRNLKNEETAAALLKREMDNCDGVELQFSDTKDCVPFIRFMMGGCV